MQHIVVRPAAADSHSIAGSPRSSSPQDTSAGAPQEPTLQSSVAQHAARTQQANARSVSVHEQEAAAYLPEQAAGQISVGEEAGAETEEHVASKLESSSGKQAGMRMSEGPQEPALQSDLVQDAALTEGGKFLFIMLLNQSFWAGP